MSLLPQNIPPELARAAEIAGIRDVDTLGVLDLDCLPRDASGRFQNAHAVVDQLRQDRPHLFKERPDIKKMSAAERDQYLRDMAREGNARFEEILLERKLAELHKMYPNARARS